MQGTLNSFVTGSTKPKRSREDSSDLSNERSTKKQKTNPATPANSQNTNDQDENSEEEIELDINFDELDKELDQRTVIINITKGTLNSQAEAIALISKHVTKPVDYEYLRLSENGNRIFVVLRNESDIDPCIQEFKATNCTIQKYDTNFGKTPGIVLFTAAFTKEHIVTELRKFGVDAKIENIAINHGKGTGTTIVSGLTDDVVCKIAQRRVLPIKVPLKENNVAGNPPEQPKVAYVSVDGHMPGTAKLVKMTGFRGVKLTTKHVKAVTDKIGIPIQQIFVPKDKKGNPMQFAVLRMYNSADLDNILTKQYIVGKLKFKFQRYKRRTGKSKNAEGNKKI